MKTRFTLICLILFVHSLFHADVKIFADDSLISKFNGWWYESSAPGTGLSLEINNNNEWFMAWYVYDNKGAPCWYTASGIVSNSMNFNGDLLQWTGWPWGTSYNPPSYKKIGQVSGILSDPTEHKITLNWSIENIGSGVLNLTNFMDDMVTNSSVSSDLTGWWYDPKYDGMGFFIEVKGNTLFMAWYRYGEDGAPTWLTSSGNLSEGLSMYVGSLSLWQNGQTPGTPYKQPQEISNQGNIKLTFTNSTEAVLVVNDATTLNLRKFFSRKNTDCFSIPQRTISIDGNFNDWQGVPVFVYDRLNEIDNIIVHDIDKAYIAMDEEYLYFRIDLREDAGNFHSFSGNCRFESYDPERGIDRWFVVWTDPEHFGYVDIENLYNNGTSETIKIYPSGFAAITGNKVEYKIKLSDTADFNFNNKFMTITVFNGDSNVDDTTINILIKESCDY